MGEIMSIVYILYLVYIPYARGYIELKSDNNNVRFDFNYGDGCGLESNQTIFIIQSNQIRYLD